MLDEDRKALMALTNSQKDIGIGPIHGILRTNAYSLTPLFDGSKLRPDGANVYSAVLKIGSRINHRYMRFLNFLLQKYLYMRFLTAAGPT